MIDLDALEKLAAQATPGPWVANSWGRVWYTPNPDSKQLVCDTMRNTVRNPRRWRANAKLIAAMREALPELIAENRALQERVRELERQRDKFAAYLETLCRYCDRDGHCPIFNYCPAPDLLKSCGDMKKEDWITAAEEAE
jgi:hypothetical protein